jgi:hypothetical protein
MLLTIISSFLKNRKLLENIDIYTGRFVMISNRIMIHSFLVLRYFFSEILKKVRIHVMGRHLTIYMINIGYMKTIKR